MGDMTPILNKTLAPTVDAFTSQVYTRFRCYGSTSLRERNDRSVSYFPRTSFTTERMLSATSSGASR
jgi:hypothetical protein